LSFLSQGIVCQHAPAILVKAEAEVKENTGPIVLRQCHSRFVP